MPLSFPKKSALALIPFFRLTGFKSDKIRAKKGNGLTLTHRAFVMDMEPGLIGWLNPVTAPEVAVTPGWNKKVHWE